MGVSLVLVLVGLLLIAIGAVGALNARRTRERIHDVNRSRPPGDRARSVAGITAWCVVSVAVGVALVVVGLT
jgi:hypothetical protein